MSERDFTLERDVHHVHNDLPTDPDPTERPDPCEQAQDEFNQLRHRLLPEP